MVRRGFPFIFFLVFSPGRTALRKLILDSAFVFTYMGDSRNNPVFCLVPALEPFV